MSDKQKATAPTAKNGATNAAAADTELALKDQSPASHSSEVATITRHDSSNSMVQPIDLSKGMPDMDKMEAAPFDLMADYWTPQKEGERKKLIFSHIGTRQVLDQKEPGLLIDLECAFFYEQITDKDGNKQIVSISNGSKRLVGAIQANNLDQGAPLEVTYLGKKKNKNNAYMSDNWSVRPLIIRL